MSTKPEDVQEVFLALQDLAPGGGSEAQILLHQRSLSSNSQYKCSIMTDRLSYGKLFRPAFFVSYLAKDHAWGFLRKVFGIGVWLPYEQTHPNYYKIYGGRSKLLKLKHLLLIFVYRIFADALIVQTESAKRAWLEDLKDFDAENIFVLPNIFEMQALAKKKSKDALHIVMVGRLIPVKDFDLALQVFHRLKKAGRNFRVSIYGEGPLRSSLENRSRELDIDKIVSFKGFESQKQNIYGSADLLLMTSFAEGMPNAIGEAMSFGLGVLALDFEAGPRDLLTREQIVESRNPDDIAQKLLELTADEAMFKEIGVQNAKTIAERFSADAFRAKFQGITNQFSLKKFSFGFLALAAIFLSFLSTQFLSVNDPPDSQTYLSFAETLPQQFAWTKGADVNLFRTPGYPLFLKVLGAHRPVVLAAQWLLLVVTGLLLYCGLARAHRKVRFSVLSFLTVFCLDPLLLYSASVQLSENLFLFLITASFILLFAPKTVGQKSVIFASVLQSFVPLVRPSGIFVPILSTGILLWRRQVSPRLAGVFFVIAIFPSCLWVARNHQTSGIATLATVGVYNLAHFRAAALLADEKKISMLEAQALVREQVGAEIKTKEDDERHKKFAQDAFLKNPIGLVKQIVKFSLFQLLDPGGVYLLQAWDMAPSGTGILGRMTREGITAVFDFLRAFGALSILVLTASGVVTAFWYYLVMKTGSWSHPFVQSSFLFGAALILLQAGPEATGRFRIPLIPLLAGVALLGRRK